jgi:hypothetical protein
MTTKMTTKSSTNIYTAESGPLRSPFPFVRVEAESPRTRKHSEELRSQHWEYHKTATPSVWKVSKNSVEISVIQHLSPRYASRIEKWKSNFLELENTQRKPKGCTLRQKHRGSNKKCHQGWKSDERGCRGSRWVAKHNTDECYHSWLPAANPKSLKPSKRLFQLYSNFSYCTSSEQLLRNIKATWTLLRNIRTGYHSFSRPCILT